MHASLVLGPRLAGQSSSRQLPPDFIGVQGVQSMHACSHVFSSSCVCAVFWTTAWCRAANMSVWSSTLRMLTSILTAAANMVESIQTRVVAVCALRSFSMQLRTVLAALTIRLGLMPPPPQKTAVLQAAVMPPVVAPFISSTAHYWSSHTTPPPAPPVFALFTGICPQGNRRPKYAPHYRLRLLKTTTTHTALCPCPNVCLGGRAGLPAPQGGGKPSRFLSGSSIRPSCCVNAFYTQSQISNTFRHDRTSRSWCFAQPKVGLWVRV